MRRLATKIIMLVTIVALGIGISSAHLASVIMRDALQREIENRAQVICRSLNGLIAQQVMENDRVKTRFVLMNMVETEKEVKYSYVIDFEGGFFAHSFKK